MARGEKDKRKTSNEIFSFFVSFSRELSVTHCLSLDDKIVDRWAVCTMFCACKRYLYDVWKLLGEKQSTREVNEKRNFVS